MKTLLISLVLIVCLCSIGQALDCSTNPCQIGGYFNETNGYRCFQVGPQALCTCPGSGYEMDQPCRLCNRNDIANNVCQLNSKLIMCLENNDCGTSYSCLCMDSAAGTTYHTTNANCDPGAKLTCGTTTGTLTPSPCLNGGVFVSGICNCPSGFGGPICQDKEDYNLCQRVRCKSNGVCAIQNPNGPYEAVCLCRYGTWGEYCELNGTLGFCSSSSCLNGGACRENVIGTTRHAYCQCEPGWKGTRCETSYFTCTKAGKFIDTDLHDQAKYFECTIVSGGFRIQRRSCPKGLRFNETLQLCTY